MSEFQPEWFKDYIKTQRDVLGALDPNILTELAIMLYSAFQKGNTAWFAANGGSLSNCQHAAQDFTKGVKEKTNLIPKCFCLGSNPSFVSAVSNDIEYNDIFRFELESLAKPNDLLIGISVSGNSENVVRAFDWANNNGVYTISLTGNFGNNKLHKMAKYALSLPSMHFGIVEDATMTILHSVCYYMMSNLSKEEK